MFLLFHLERERERERERRKGEGERERERGERGRGVNRGMHQRHRRTCKQSRLVGKR